MDKKEKLKKIKEKNKGLFSEFKTFVLRGNVLDLAVGVIIGAAFQKIVTSLTDNIISPILGCFSNVDFSKFVLHVGKLDLKYGAFVTDIINFIIMAFVVFLFIKFINKITTIGKKKKEEEEPVIPVLTKDQELLTEIKELLEKQSKKK